MTLRAYTKGPKYFAVNDKPMGVSTSYRVSGRRGEIGRRFPLYSDAQDFCRALNKAYELGMKHALEGAVIT